MIASAAKPARNRPGAAAMLAAVAAPSPGTIRLERMKNSPATPQTMITRYSNPATRAWVSADGPASFPANSGTPDV
jgi:hypothetical protein